MSDAARDTMIHLRYELLRGGDGTIMWFLPNGGAYVFMGDAKSNGTAINEHRGPEAFFNPALTVADREKLEQFPGDGPWSYEGTREELYALLGLRTPDDPHACKTREEWCAALARSLQEMDAAIDTQLHKL